MTTSLAIQTTPALTTLRPARSDDWQLIRRWLAEPHVAAWWGGADAGLASIALIMDQPSALARIIMAGGRPVGWVHAVDMVLWQGAAPPGLPPGTWDANLFIGEADLRGAGHGLAGLALLVDELFATTLAPALCRVVALRRERAVRTYEQAGFRWHAVWQDPIEGPCWVMLRERG